MTTAISANLRTAAFAAIREAADRRGPINIMAAKILRDRTGLTLVEVVGAVRWALEHPQAEHLPVHSIVADRENVYLRNDRSVDNPWIVMGASGDGKYVNVADHEEVNELIQSGAGMVLRVGGGS